MCMCGFMHLPGVSTKACSCTHAVQQSWIDQVEIYHLWLKLGKYLKTVSSAGIAYYLLISLMFNKIIFVMGLKKANVCICLRGQPTEFVSEVCFGKSMKFNNITAKSCAQS